VPPWTLPSKYRYWPDFYLDIAPHYLMGAYWGETKWSLNHLAKTFGLPVKPEDATDFHSMLESGDSSLVERAKAYLIHDLVVTRSVSERMGVV
jgi:hypothetical protein